MRIVERGISGSTHYFRIFDGSSPEKIWNGSSFVTYVLGNYATYAIAATEYNSLGRFSVTRPRGVMRWELVLQAGGSPSATDDTVVAQGEELSDEALQLIAVCNGVRNAYFVRPWDGDDTNNSGLSPRVGVKSITKALSFCAAGDEVRFNGTPDQSSANPDLYVAFFTDLRQVAVPAGVWLHGATMATAVVYTDFDGTGSVAVTASGNGAAMSDFTIRHVFGPSGSTFTTPIGYNANPTKDVRVDRVRTIADSDGFYFNSSTGQGTGYWRGFDCINDANYDAAVILGTNADQRLDLFNSWQFVVGPSNNLIHNISRAVTGQQGVIALLGGGGFVTTTDETITNDVNVVYARDGSGRSQRIVMIGYTPWTNLSTGYAGNEKLIRCDANSSLVIAGVPFDPTSNKVQFDGRVTFQPQIIFAKDKDNKAGARDALGMATNNLDTQLSGLADDIANIATGGGGDEEIIESADETITQS